MLRMAGGTGPHLSGYRGMRILLSVAAVLLMTSAAAAEIRIRQSLFKDGMLIIRGETEPGRVVTLERKFRTKANRYGRFTFRVPYKPAYCVADIRSGRDIYSAVITNCYNPGSYGTGPAQPR